ncbi:MAG: transposase, partial [Candidatus Promineifilaceae bacterium]|nr:transposase [Candidatus Promineifilaceae bacterium]
VDVDASVIMPNHMHGIVVLYDPVGAGPRTRPDDHDHPPLGQTRAGPRTHPDDPDPPPLGQTRDNHGVTTGQPQGARTGQPQGAAPTTPDRQQSGRMSLSDVVHRFKTLTTKRYTDGVKQMGWKPYNRRVWQRNYYEHIVRNEGSLQRIRDYIVGNPALWDEDRENPDVVNKKNER